MIELEDLSLTCKGRLIYTPFVEGNAQVAGAPLSSRVTDAPGAVMAEGSNSFMTSLKNNDCRLVSSAIRAINERKKAKLAIHFFMRISEKLNSTVDIDDLFQERRW